MSYATYLENRYQDRIDATDNPIQDWEIRATITLPADADTTNLFVEDVVNDWDVLEDGSIRYDLMMTYEETTMESAIDTFRHLDPRLANLELDVDVA